MSNRSAALTEQPGPAEGSPSKENLLTREPHTKAQWHFEFEKHQYLNFFFFFLMLMKPVCKVGQSNLAGKVEILLQKQQVPLISTKEGTDCDLNKK